MKINSKFAAVAPLIALTLVMLAGCSASVSSLEGTNWQLTASTLSSIDPASSTATGTITASFVDGVVTGSSGVNSYSGPYKVREDGSFTAGPLASTRMSGPKAEMLAEEDYMALFQQAKSYTLENDTLTIVDAKGNESLTFRPYGE